MVRRWEAVSIRDRSSERRMRACALERGDGGGGNGRSVARRR